MEKLSPPKQPIRATCHCTAITITAPGHPEKPINECQCTLCRRYGAEWAYYNTNDVKIEKKDGASFRKYSYGNNPSADFCFCETCGCMMMWCPFEVPQAGAEMGLNSRMMDPDAVKGVNKIKCFDDLYK